MNTKLPSSPFTLKSRRECLRLLGCLSTLVPTPILASEPQGTVARQKSKLRGSPAELPAGELGFRFTDVAMQAGLGQATNVTGGKTTKRYLLEEMGCGIAFFDYDNDGWMDIFMVNGTAFELPSSSTSIQLPFSQQS